MSPKAKDPKIIELRRTLGLRIRDLRTQLGLTLSELAVQTGVTASALSQFENGHSEPSLTTLWKLSRTLGAPILELPSSEDPVVEVGRIRDGRQLLDFGTYCYEILTQAPSRRLDFFLLTIEPGDRPIRDPLSHPGEDCGYVLSGQVDVAIGETTYILNKGDCIWFVSTQAHTFIPRGRVRSLSVWANTLTTPAAIGKGPFAGLSLYAAIGQTQVHPASGTAVAP